MTLQLVDVDHHYGRRQSLFGVGITVRPGDLYGFIGHNGAGKTTTLRIALGLDRATRGRVLIDGFDAREHIVEARARLGGMIETTGFYPWASGRENLRELARLQGLARRGAAREADRWLDVVGLAERARSAVRTYSQGMRQRLGLAQALIGKPSYVLLDEPQNGLDPEGIAELREVLRRLTRDHGMTIVLSSHQLAELSGLCNRIGVLREGRLLLEAETEALLATTRGRFELETDDRAATDAILEKLDILRTPAADGASRELVELGGVDPRTLVRELVGAGVGVERIAPRPGSLEEVYLRLAADPGSLAAIAERPPEPTVQDAPSARCAPGGAIVRVAAYELRRSLRRWPSALLVAIPAFLAWQRIAALAEDNAVHLAAVEDGELFSTSVATGFEAFGRGVVAASPALAVMFVAIGSQSVAGEISLGTLRNVLLRPLRRWQLAIGKALAMLVALLVAHAALLGSAWLSAGAYFDFGNRYEVSREGDPELWIEAIDVWPLVPDAMLAPILPLFAYAGLGFVAGTLATRAIWALGIAIAAALALDIGRSIARPLGFESWLPSAYLPSPLGDSSYLAYYLDVSIGSAEAAFEYERTALLVPLLWCVATFGIGTFLVVRKRVS